jgi:hypothetical protein
MGRIVQTKSHPAGRWNRWLAVLVSLAALTTTTRSRAAPTGFTVGAEPAWIAPAEPGPDDSGPAQRELNGVRTLLVDHQRRLREGGSDHYARIVRRITNESGL